MKIRIKAMLSLLCLCAMQSRGEPPKGSGQLLLESGIEYLRIHSTDFNTAATSTFLAEPSVRARATWDYALNNLWSLRTRIHYQSVEIQQDTVLPIQPILGQLNYPYGVEFGVIRHYNLTTRTAFLATYRERVFDFSQDILTVNFEKVRAPGFLILHEVDIWRLSFLSVGVSVSAELILSGSGSGYTTGLGLAGDGAGYVRTHFGWLSLFGTAYYGITRQSTSLAKRDEDRLGFLGGLSIRM